MYRFFVNVGLVVTLVLNTLFPFLRHWVRETPEAENGSLVAADALGRPTTTAEKSKKQVGLFYFLWLGEHSCSIKEPSPD